MAKVECGFVASGEVQKGDFESLKEHFASRGWDVEALELLRAWADRFQFESARIRLSIGHQLPAGIRGICCELDHLNTKEEYQGDITIPHFSLAFGWIDKDDGRVHSPSTSINSSLERIERTVDSSGEPAVVFNVGGKDQLRLFLRQNGTVTFGGSLNDPEVDLEYIREQALLADAWRKLHQKN